MESYGVCVSAREQRVPQSATGRAYDKLRRLLECLISNTTLAARAYVSGAEFISVFSAEGEI